MKLNFWKKKKGAPVALFANPVVGQALARRLWARRQEEMKVCNRFPARSGDGGEKVTEEGREPVV